MLDHVRTDCTRKTHPANDPSVDENSDERREHRQQQSHRQGKAGVAGGPVVHAAGAGAGRRLIEWLRPIQPTHTGRGRRALPRARNESALSPAGVQQLRKYP